jgi:hypothetical protein
MHVSSLSELMGLDSGDPGDIGKAARPLFHNVVILPDGTVTWSAEVAPEVIPAVDCEVVPEWYPVVLRIPQPQPPEVFVTIPEFTSGRI